MSGSLAAEPLRKGFAGAALATLIALAILVLLGIWQLQRLHWKEAMLARIDAAEAAPPAPLLPGTTPPPFARIVASGTFRPGATGLYGAEVRDMPDGVQRMGAQALAVLDRRSGPPLLVVLGWVPTDGFRLAEPSGRASVTGYARLPEPAGWLSATDDNSGRRFYSLNPQAIGPALGVPDLAPFTLVALGPPVTSGSPQPAEALPRPPNNHLQYALTWFGLAGALVAVFVAWSLRRD